MVSIRMKAPVLVLAAVFLFGCIQAPESVTVSNGATGTPVPTAVSGSITASSLNAESLFDRSGFVRYSVAVTFPGNLTEEQKTIADIMQELVQGQESTLAWVSGAWRLDSQVGVLGQTLNQTAYLDLGNNNSQFCVDGKCEPAAQEDTQERLDVAKKALQRPFQLVPMPSGVDAEKAWIVTSTGPSIQAGRSCDGFDLTLNQTYMNQTLYARSAGDFENIRQVKQAVLFKGITSPLPICLDQERGYVARVQMRVNLSVAEKELSGLTMAVSQTVQEFRDEPYLRDVLPPAYPKAEKPRRPSGLSILSISDNHTTGDGTRYSYAGKQNGSFALDVSNIQNASCPPKRLMLPEWTTFECDGTRLVFLIYEEESDEFQLAVQQFILPVRPYDPQLRPVYAVARNQIAVMSDVPLIVMYEGKSQEGESLLVGPWEGPCPTQRLYLDGKPGSYTCEGQTFLLQKSDGSIENELLGIRVIKK